MKMNKLSLTLMMLAIFINKEVSQYSRLSREESNICNLEIAYREMQQTQRGFQTTPIVLGELHDNFLLEVSDCQIIGEQYLEVAGTFSIVEEDTVMLNRVTRPFANALILNCYKSKKAHHSQIFYCQDTLAATDTNGNFHFKTSYKKEGNWVILPDKRKTHLPCYEFLVK